MITPLDTDRIRNDFPLLRRPDEERPVYLDNACMTLKPDLVIQAITEYYETYPACADRSVHHLSNRVTLAVDDARAKLARLVNSPTPRNIAFTKNTTEAINQVCWGYPLRRDDVVLTSDKEHNSNLIPWKRREQVDGIRHAWFATTPDGAFDEEAFKDRVSALGNRLKLVSVVHVSNLDGQAFPIKTIADITHDAGAHILVDAAQSVPHQRVDVQALDVDFLAWSVHKMMGPTGVGCLYGHTEALGLLEARHMGGNTVADARLDGFEALDPPHTLEAGLQNYAGIIGAGAAARYLMDIGPHEVGTHTERLNGRLTKRLVDDGTATVHGPTDARMRGAIVPFTVPGMDSHDLALYLDEAARICLRSGAHCVHSFLNARGAAGWARASLYAYNTAEECDLLATTIAELVRRLAHTR